MVFPSEQAKQCPTDWIGECVRHPSQLYEAALEGLLLGIILLAFVVLFQSFKRPGETVSIFLIGYGLSRAIIEIFREPDLQLITELNPNGYVIFVSESVGLSMGQILCAPMIIIGIALILTRHFMIFKFKRQ